MKNKLLLTTCIPIVVFALLSMMVGLAQYSTSLYEKTEAYLKSTALCALTLYSGRGYGDYDEKVDGNIWRGMNFNISKETFIVDELKRQLGIDITVYFNNKAVMTSIINENGARCIGMDIDTALKRNVIENGYQLWCKSIKVNDKECQAYVIPIRQESDDHVIGAIMASQSIRPFNWDITKYIFKTMITMLVILITVFLFILKNVDLFTQKYSEVASKSEHDLLTGLYNKVAFEQNCARDIKRAHADNEVGILWILDFDNFKHVNDDYGHQVGDEALKGFARILKRAFRRKDIIGRVGGDEFMVFMKAEPQSVGRVDAIAKRVLHDLYDLKIQNAAHFTCSIGIGIDFRGRYNFGELYQCADQALYQSKENGKACFSKKY